MRNPPPKVGINYRKEIADDIIKHLTNFDIIEINTERLFTNEQDKKLAQIMDSVPYSFHGLSLSLGDEDNISKKYLINLEKLMKKTECEWFSEHVSTTKVSGIEVRNLLPVPMNEKTALKIAKKINQITSITEKPFLIENISYYYPMPGSNMPEVDFINLILNETTCGMLLDLNNLFCNASNHHYDPKAFINQLPYDKIKEIHLAGSADIDNMKIDTHACHISPEVYDLFKYCSTKIPFASVIIERDTGGPSSLSEVLAETAIIKKIVNQSYHEVIL